MRSAAAPAAAALLALALLALRPAPARGSADEITFSSLHTYYCRAAFAGGRYRLHWAIDRSMCPGTQPAVPAHDPPSRRARRWSSTRIAAMNHHHRRLGARRASDALGSQLAAAHDPSALAERTARWQAKRMNDTLSPRQTADAEPLCAEAELALAIVVEFRGAAAVEARAHGWWVAFGVGEAGGLRGVDFVRYDSKSNKLTDAHTTRTPAMTPDEHQDWRLAAPPNVTLLPRQSSAAAGSLALDGTFGGGAPAGGAAPTRRVHMRSPRDQPHVLRATIRLRRRLRTPDLRFDHDLVAVPSRRTAATRVVGQWGVGHYDAELAEAAQPLAVGASGAPPVDAGGLGAYVRASLRLLTRCSADPFAALRRDPTVARVEVRVQRHAVAARRRSGWGLSTEAHTFACVNLEHIKGLGGRHFDGHVVGVAPLLTHGAGPRAPLRQLTLLGYRQHCPDDGVASPELRSAQLHADSLEALYFWAPGAAPLLLPAQAGLRLGGRQGYRALVLRLWYEALDGAAALGDGSGGDLAAPPVFVGEDSDAPPEATSELARAAAGGSGAAVIDQSGVALFVTHLARPYDAGLLQLGDAQLGLIEQRLPKGSSTFKFSCPSDCSLGHFGGKTLRVYARSMHMRSHGERIATTLRAHNGSVLRIDAVRARARPRRPCHACAKPRSASAGRPALPPPPPPPFLASARSPADGADARRAPTTARDRAGRLL